MKYTLTMNVWVNEPDEECGPVSASSIKKIVDKNGRIIQENSEEWIDICRVLWPNHFDKISQ